MSIKLQKPNKTFVQQVAYFLWVSKGMPVGKEKELYAEAEKNIDFFLKTSEAKLETVKTVAKKIVTKKAVKKITTKKAVKKVGLKKVIAKKTVKKTIKKIIKKAVKKVTKKERLPNNIISLKKAKLARAKVKKAILKNSKTVKKVVNSK